MLLERNPDYKNNDKKKHELQYPGGKIEGDETSKDCAIRETSEETSGFLKIIPEQLKKFVVSVSPSNKEIYLYIVELTDEQSQKYLWN